MLRVYLQSAEAVDKRMETAAKTPLTRKEHDGKGGVGERMDANVAELDKFMGSVTNAALVQEARRFMVGSQPEFCSHTLS
jgi:hypothetical protein